MLCEYEFVCMLCVGEEEKRTNDKHEQQQKQQTKGG